MYTVEHIDPSKTALIVVDMQNDFVAAGAPLESRAGREMLPHLNQALTCCRDHGIPVIYTAHVGKHRLVSPADRFARLVPEMVAVLRSAWAPQEEGSQQYSAEEKGRDAIQRGHKA